MKKQHEQQVLATTEEKLKAAIMAQEVAAAKAGEEKMQAEMVDLRQRFASMMELIDKSRESLADFTKYRKATDTTIKALTKDNDALKKKALKTDATLIELADEVCVCL